MKPYDITYYKKSHKQLIIGKKYNINRLKHNVYHKLSQHVDSIEYKDGYDILDKVINNKELFEKLHATTVIDHIPTYKNLIVFDQELSDKIDKEISIYLLSQ